MKLQEYPYKWFVQFRMDVRIKPKINEMKKLFFVILSVLCGSVISIQEDNPYIEALRRQPWKSEQKYVEVRPGAHLFYWFYYADGTVVNSSQKPLIIWVQGGPGLAATGIANFAEIGPLDMEMKPRYHTWVKGRNVLLIDHPVGTGFSYATNISLYVTTDREIATDLSQVIKTFLKWHKEFRQTPAYLFGQSYGGKIAPRLGYYLQSAINKGKLKMNFKGIGIGSGWVNPRESTLIYPHYLYNLGMIDQSTYTKAKSIVKQLSALMDKRDYSSAGLLEMRLFMTISTEAGIDMNFNNINQDSPYPKLEKLAEKINKYVKPTLSHVVNESIVWSYMSEKVFYSLKKSFLVPSTKFLEMLLNNTTIKIAVYNGNLDVVTPIAGAANWAHKLNWNGVDEFKKASVTKIQGTRNGFYKTARQFSFWWVFGSGHWVPEDNPVAMKQILDYMTDQ